MALQSVLRHIRRLAESSAPPPSDRELLRAFARNRDEAAFAELVRRHGPLVRGVARRVLGDADGADDVFQAAFLVLARKAAVLRWRRYIGSWLSAAAYRLACKARTAAARRRRNEQAAARQRPDCSSVPAWAELQAVLDEELHRLPERYRAPLLLCYYEGLARDEAARRLGWSFGTLCRRLAEGRDTLRRRLERRGAALGAGLLAAGAPEALTATVPPALVRATVAAAAALRWPAFGVVKMTLAAAALAGVLSAVGVGVGMLPAPLAPPAVNPPATGVPGPAVRADLYGDPLPERAVARLGTLRLPEQDEVLTPGGRIAVLRGGRVAWLDPATRREVGRLSGPAGAAISTFTMSPDGRRVIYQSDKDLWCWDVATDREAFHLVPPRRSMGRTYQFSPDGRKLAWTTQVNMSLYRTHVSDAADGRELWAFGETVQAGRECCLPLGFSPDGQALVTWVYTNLNSGRERLVIRSADTGAEQLSIPINATDGRGRAVAKNARTFALGLTSGVVRLWDLTTGQELPPLDKELTPAGNDRWGMNRWYVGGVAFADDDRELIVSHMDGTVRAWDWVNRKLLWQVRLPEGAGRVRVAPDGRSLQTVFPGESRWRTFDVTTGQERVPSALGHTAMLFGVKYSADGTRVITTGQDRTIRVWDPTTGRQLQCITAGCGMSAWSFDASPDGRWFATSNGNVATAWLLDAATGREVRVLDHGKGSVTRVAFSPDGRRLITVGGYKGDVGDLTTRVWGVTSGREIGRIEESILWLTFSPDGRTLLGIIGNRDHTLLVVDMETYRVRQRIPLETGNRAFGFSPDRRSLIAWDNVGKTLAWLECATGRVRLDVPLPEDGWAESPTVSPDGKLLATSSPEGSGVFLRDAHTGQALPPLHGHSTWPRAFSFSPDGRRLVSASGDATALVWDVSDLPPPRPMAELTPADLDAAWTTLADADARKAYQALLKLTDAPAATVPFLRRRLRPATAVDSARLNRLLADLAGPRFADREAARRTLAALDTQAEPALRRFVTGTPATEARQRAEQLLARFDGPLTDPERLRELRAVEALERLATPAAIELLQDLASGAPDARLTCEALAALQRRPGPRR